MSASSADIMPTPQETVPALKDAADVETANAIWIVQAMRGDFGPREAPAAQLKTDEATRAAVEEDEKERDAIRATMTPQDWRTIYDAIVSDTRRGWFNVEEPSVFKGVNARVLSGGLRQTVGFTASMLGLLSGRQIDLLTQGLGETRVVRDGAGRAVGLTAGIGLIGESRRVWTAPNWFTAGWRALTRRIFAAS